MMGNQLITLSKGKEEAWILPFLYKLNLRGTEELVTRFLFIDHSS